jgi:uncharacterized protein with FMN-binding domain
MRKTLAALLSAAAFALPIVDAVAATPRKTVVTKTKTIAGSTAQADRWGDLQVSVVVRKTTTTVGSKVRVTRRIVKLTVPVYPNHTDRSVFINQQALPYLIQETLKAQSTDIQLISGATATSYAFAQSLQAAILQAKKF